MAAPRCPRRVDAEALVRWRGTRYSVPARYCGGRVEVEAHAGTVTIRSGDRVIASHPERRGAPGTRVEQPEHVQERWEGSQANGPAARPLCDFHFEGDAAGLERPLSAYDQEAA